MPEKTDLSFAFNLPPEKAIDYFKSKGYAITFNWYDVWQEAHAKAFTVAKAMRMDILEDIRGEVDTALKDGTTYQDFRNNLEPMLKKKGWWGYKETVKEDGTIDKILEGSPWRLKTIFQTNMQTALSAGKYKEQMDNVDDRPYFQYVAVMDNRTRPEHRLLNGKVFRYDDPFWDTHYPPLGFNCRCRVRTLTPQEVKRKGLKVTEGKNHISWEEQPLSKNTTEKRKVAVYTDPIIGKKIPTDVGWSYNPGKSAWFPELDKYDYDVAKQYTKGGLTGPDFKAFFESGVGGTFPVAVINNNNQKAIGSKSQVVNLSKETLMKNISEHPEIKFEIYQKLPDIVENAQLIVKDRETTFVFLRIDKEIYYGAIKTTQTGQTNFLTSLRKAEMEDIALIKRKGKVLKDEL